jgi:tetratricopeptide (TPR) repeat protein
VFVASNQRKLYFTYNGGPVFNLTAAPPAPAPAAPASATPEPVAPEPGAPGGAAAGAGSAAPADENLDAATYARRGAAETSRHDYEHAIADLTRACELAPTQPDFFYERGMAYWWARQVDPALADFDQAIKLKPDYVNALLARARLHLSRKDANEVVIADLDAAARAAPTEDAARLSLGELYQKAGNPTVAVAEFTKFIDSHPSDEVSLATALNGRCWTRALAGRELEQALDDCDRAVRRRPDRGALYDTRALVQLRMAHYDRAISDYDTALRLRPKNPWSLYCRGIAKVRKGDKAGGQADIAAATALAPKIAEEAALYDIKP